MTSLDKAPAEPDDVEIEHEDLATLASTAPVGGSTRDHLHNYWQRVRGGDMGSLPAVSGLILLTVIFSLAQPSFHSLFNLGNMFTEGSATIFIAMGLVFVLLLGEIDLAAGYTAGVCGGGDGPADDRLQPRLGAHHPGRARHRPDHRLHHRLVARQGAHPVLRRHAGVLPRLPGRDALHRQQRQGPEGRPLAERQCRARLRELADAAVVRLGTGRRSRRRLRRTARLGTAGPAASRPCR